LQRLEWTTRFRPVHIGTLLLGAVAPHDDSEFIYSPGEWYGEAKLLFTAAGLTHVRECPLEDGARSGIQELIGNRLPAVLARIRRSLKPRRLALISKRLEQFLPALTFGELPCAILLDRERPFALDEDLPSEAAGRLWDAFAAPSTHATGL